MRQGAESSNEIEGAEAENADVDSTRKLRSVPAGRAFLTALGEDVRLAFRFGWHKLMSGLQQAYAAWKRARQSRTVSQRAIISSAPVSRLRAQRSAGLRVLRAYGGGLAVLLVVGTLALAAGAIWVSYGLSLKPLPQHGGRPPLLLEASGGAPLGRVGPLRIADVTRQDLPDHLVQAVLSVEDRRFYSHFGIDPFAIVRAARRNISAGKIVEGGSTITQQLVKMRYVGHDRSFSRKLREALIAIWIDLRLSKDDILTSYLNTIYFGSGAIGIGAAARLYFDKEVPKLTLAESAMLVGLIRAPSQYSPIRDLAASRARAAVVLDSMVENGAIDAKTAASSKANAAVLNSAPASAQAESWFADWIAQQAISVTGSSDQSIRVRTTLVPEVQALAEKIVEDALAKEGARANASQAALVAMRPDGAVIAMVGGRDYRTGQFNRAAEANRHPGSAFKVFVYLAALRKGYLPDDVIDAGPVVIKDWRPENFGGAQYGRVTFGDALVRSINTATVRLAMEVGLNDVIKAARDLGIDARMAPVPSLALGAVEVSLLDLTGAFASLRAGRTGIEPWGIAAFGNEDDPYMRTAGPPVARSARSLGAAHEPMVDMLRRVVEQGTGRRAAVGGFAAGKTGTSQNHRDAWFIGFTDSLIVGVWVGNDDNSPMKNVVGGALPALIWRRFVLEATPRLGPDDKPVAAVAAPAETPPKAPATTNETTGALVRDRCDIAFCSRKYRSFDASDCTYQPYGRGPREVCEAGPYPSTTANPRAEREIEDRRPDRWSGGWRRDRDLWRQIFGR